MVSSALCSEGLTPTGGVLERGQSRSTSPEMSFGEFRAAEAPELWMWIQLGFVWVIPKGDISFLSEPGPRQATFSPGLSRDSWLYQGCGFVSQELRSSALPFASSSVK